MRSGGSQGNYRLPALRPCAAPHQSRSQPPALYHPCGPEYWDDEDEDEFPLKDDPFFMCYGGEQQEEMGTGHYLATLLLFAIPVVGLIMMIYWSLCGSKWEERQKLATACMIKRLVGDLVILALLIAAHSVIVGLSYMPILLGGMGY